MLARLIRTNRSQGEMNTFPRASFLWAILLSPHITICSSASADAQSIRRGKLFARANCSYCHSIDKVSRSPRRDAPPFRSLHKKYPVETLEDALAEGMSTGHPRMPEFRLDPGEVGDFISFLKSFK